MKNKITIVVCSREEQDKKTNFIKNIESTCGIEYELVYILNKEGIGLSPTYHNMLNVSDNDIIVFIHDDIEFIIPNWGKELVRMFEENQEYGIIGVAGTSDFNSRCIWWGNKHKYGQVLHRDNGKTFLTVFSELLDKDLEEVCVIDGLFMAVDRTRIVNNFDEHIDGFHFYDIDFCLSNFLTKKVKIGVTTKIRVAHNSVGKLNEEWYKTREIIKDKYNKYFPIKV